MTTRFARSSGRRSTAWIAWTRSGRPGELYTRGLQDFLTVLDTQRALYAAQDQLVQSEQAVAANLIALYKALGGGWEATLEAGPARDASRHVRSEPDRESR